MSESVILAINAGSSSVKASLFLSRQGEDPVELAEVEVSGLSSPPAKIKYSCHGQQKVKGDEVQGVDSQGSAFDHILEVLVGDDDLSEVETRDHITHVAHRVVHGGDYSEPQVIDRDTMHHLEDLTDLAPLHNASALGIVRSCIEKLPKAQNVAVFDSQYHQTIPEHVRTIPIDQTIAKKNKLRKYVCHLPCVLERSLLSPFLRASMV